MLAKIKKYKKHVNDIENSRKIVLSDPGQYNTDFMPGDYPFLLSHGDIYKKYIVLAFQKQIKELESQLERL